MIHEEKHLTSALTSEDKVSEEGKSVKELAKDLCEKSGCHHKCNDTTDCVVDDEALLLINENKSNNFDVKSNNEIEEMAFILGDACAGVPHKVCETTPCNHCRAEALYNAGYRKQSEGEWRSELVKRYDWKGKKHQYYQPNSCSLCHEAVLKRTPFCPNCGAKMKGGAE